MVSGHYVAPNPLEFLAAGLRSAGGMKGEALATKELADIGQREKDMMISETKALSQALRGTPGQMMQPTTPNDDEGNINPQVQMQGTPGSFAAFTDRALQSELPQFQQLGMQGIMKMPEIEARQQDRIADREFKMQQAQEAHMRDMQRLRENNASKAEMAQVQREFMEQMERGRQAASAENIRLTAALRPDVGGTATKPLPATALKMQQEALDSLGIVGGINADLGAIEKQIDTGKLKFGPLSNLTNSAMNALGASSDNSRNFSSFKSNMERLRNESLRLNAGVQTDGDAQRAWNELFQNINDTKLVKQRLQEIQRINARGAELQKLKVDGVRANYGKDPYNFDQIGNQPAALNGGTPNQAAPKSRIRFDAQGNVIP